MSSHSKSEKLVDKPLQFETEERQAAVRELGGDESKRSLASLESTSSPPPCSIVATISTPASCSGSSTKAACAQDDPRSRTVLFCVLIMTMIAVNFDSGATAAVLSSLELGCKSAELAKSYPCLTESDQGLLGALPYIGLCVGCPFVGRLLQLKKERLVICIWLTLNVVATLIFGSVIGRLPLFCAKFCVGVSHSAICVYVPVWVDCFAPPTRRTTWLGIVQAISSLGAMVGYAIAGYLTANGLYYQFAFRIQGVWIILCIVLLAVAPKNLINVSASKCSSSSLSQLGCSPMLGLSYNDREDSESHIQVEGFWSQMKPLLRNSLFLTTALGLCSLFFVLTAIQYWASKFMVICFARTQAEVTSLFLFVSITAPVSGVAIGGTIVDRVTQGAVIPTVRLVRTWGIVASIAGLAACAIPIHMARWWFYVDILCIWVLLFFGALMLPACTGLVLQSVDEDQKPIANACSQLLTNILGFALGSGLPGQIAYVATVRGADEVSSLHTAIQVVLAIGSIAGILVALAVGPAAQKSEMQKRDVSLLHV